MNDGPGGLIKTIYQIDKKGYLYGLKINDFDGHDYTDQEVCQPHNWLPDGQLDPSTMSSSEPYIPRVVHGKIFDFYDEAVKFAPAILEVGNGGFLFSTVSDHNGCRQYSVNGRFVVPTDWSKHEFFLQLLTFLVAGHDSEMRDAFGLFFDDRDKDGDDFIFMSKSHGVFVEIGTFPKHFTRPMVTFLETCFSAPLFDFDYTTMSLKRDRF